MSHATSLVLGRVAAAGRDVIVIRSCDPQIAGWHCVPVVFLVPSAALDHALVVAPQYIPGVLLHPLLFRNQHQFL